MRRKRAGAAAIVGAAVLAFGMSRLRPGSTGQMALAPGSPPAAASPLAVGSTTPAAPAGASLPAAPAGASLPAAPADISPGACPSGGLHWTGRVFTADPVDIAADEWLVREHGTVQNSSPAAIILGDGTARVGRPDAAGEVVDLPLTPTGSLSLEPGQSEPFSGAILVQSTSRPTDLGLGPSNATWESPALASGCPAPPGSVGPAGARTGAQVD